MKQLKTVSHLRALQRLMGEAIMRPLTSEERMQIHWTKRQRTSTVAESFIKPNARLTSFQRLEIYNRQYWFRLLDCFSQDFPGLKAILGNDAFFVLAEAYLQRYPSRSFTLRNLGSKIEKFLLKESKRTAPHSKMALDMARFEWAQVVAFDGETRPALTAKEIIGKDPKKLKLSIQPYITFLHLSYPLDDFILKIRKRDALRSEASNAREEKHFKKVKPLKLPQPKEIFLAVHRSDNSLYYKRLDADAYKILIELQKGRSLVAACEKALGKRAMLEKGWPEKIREWFEQWMALGWFGKP